MAIKKIEIRPKGTDDYGTILYPKTSTDMVIDEATGKSVASHLADDAVDAHNASNISIIDSTNKFTATDVEGALSELFQFADNGKTDWATVVGSPLLTSDTFAQLKGKTQTIKNTLATNLTNKGQSSVGTDTLTNLVNKVANVQTGAKVKSIQRGIATIASNQREQLVSISRVDRTKSFIKLTFKTTEATSSQIAFARAYFTSDTQIKIERNIIATPHTTVSWEVVEYENNVIVQSGESTIATYYNETTISSVDLTKSLLIFSYVSDNSNSNLSTNIVMGRFLNNTTIEFSKGNTGGGVYIRWFVVEFI